MLTSRHERCMGFLATATAKENACVIKCKQILFEPHARSVCTYMQFDFEETEINNSINFIGHRGTESPSCCHKRTKSARVQVTLYAGAKIRCNTQAGLSYIRTSTHISGTVHIGRVSPRLAPITLDFDLTLSWYLLSRDGNEP